MRESPTWTAAASPRRSRTGARVGYGLDAPNTMRNLAIVGGALIVFGIYAGGEPGAERIAPLLAGLSIALGVGYLAASGLMFLSSRVGKRHARDAMLARLRLAPDALVLDVGCGHGLLLIGAAKRIPSGLAVGLDLWSRTDQAENSREATLANAAAEGVADRVEVHDGDMTAMPFESESFDAVVSSLAIHNVRDRESRAAAIAEIARVLRPGGQLAILDIARVNEYAAALEEYGFAHVEAPRWTPWIFPPAKMLYAVK